jgi:DNA (cytosine-5)-methyltransferase 1
LTIHAGIILVTGVNTRSVVVKQKKSKQIMMRRERVKPLQIADLFCGAGGSTEGISEAVKRLGREAKIFAINHWNVAIETHSANHPGVQHFCESVDHIDPTKLIPGQTLDLLWASPACTHHSVARGGRPRCEQQRAPAWIIPFWLENLNVKRLIIENVPEFRNWGPLDESGKQMKALKGATFRAFIQAIRSLGYSVEWRVLNAANYGDPTIRRRLFIQAIKGAGRTIRWPDITHAESRFNYQGLPKWIPARDIIDKNLHGESIFSRKRPLAPATLRRIEHGIKRFWGSYAEPFLIILRGTGTSRSLDRPLPGVTTSGSHAALIEPFLINNYGQSKSASLEDPLPTVTGNVKAALIEPFLTRFHGGADSAERNHSIDEPIPVIDTSNRYGIVEPFILPNEGVYRGNKARSLEDPLNTITASRGAGALIEPFITAINQSSAGDRIRSLDVPLGTVVTKQEHCLIEPFLVKYYGTGGAIPLDIPLGTITTKERFALVEPGGEYTLDIRFRMLQPHELAAAQGFPRGYKFCGTKTDITRQIGNAVPVNLSRELAETILSVEVT